MTSIHARLVAFLEREEQRQMFIGKRLPPWVSDPQRQLYVRTWERLCHYGVCGFSDAQIETFIQTYPEISPRPGCVQNWPDFIDAVGVLVQMEYDASLGEVEGARAISGEDAARGRKQLAGAKEGAKAIHGTEAQKAARRQKYAEIVKTVLTEHPNLKSWRGVSEAAGRRADCSGRTIREHVANPFKK